MKVVVVGASSGLGRRIGIALAERGASVALLARRLTRLADAAAQAGPNSVAIECDVTDPASVCRAIDEAATTLDGIDALLYAPGIGPLDRIEDIDIDTWRRTFDTNVIGASLVTAAALPHLARSAGVAAYLSTVSASQTPPWPGLAAYVVTKAALDKLVEAWRIEHPTVGFTRVVVGDCEAPEHAGRSEFNADWDMELFRDLYPLWQQRGLTGNGLIEIDELVAVVERVLQCGASASIPTVALTPRPRA